MDDLPIKRLEALAHRVVICHNHQLPQVFGLIGHNHQPKLYVRMCMWSLACFLILAFRTRLLTPWEEVLLGQKRVSGPRVLKLYKEQGCSEEQGETSLKSPHRSATGKELNGMLVRKRKWHFAYASNFVDTERLSLFEMAWACDNIYCWRWFLFWFNFSHFSVYRCIILQTFWNCVCV